MAFGLSAAAIGGIAAGVGAVGAAVIGSNASKSAARSAASAQKKASDAQIALQREQMAYAKQVAQPYMTAGTQADATLDARWGGSGGPSVDPYGAWGSAQTVRAGSAYDAGAPTQAWTAQGAPQVARPAAWTPPAAPPPPPPAQWDWRSVNPTGLPPLPGTQPTTPSNNANNNSSNPYGAFYGGFAIGSPYLKNLVMR